jgi:hypothetical protein
MTIQNTVYFWWSIIIGGELWYFDGCHDFMKLVDILLWGNKPSFRQGSSYTMDYELKSLRIFLLPAYVLFHFT